MKVFSILLKKVFGDVSPSHHLSFLKKIKK